MSKLSEYKKLVQFLKLAIKLEKERRSKIELFRTLFDGIFQKSFRLIHVELYSVIAELTKILELRKLINEMGRISWIIKTFKDSNSFDIAGKTSEIVLNLAQFLNEKQVDEIVDATLSNAQIYCSWEARNHLNRFLTIFQDKIEKTKLEEIREKFRL